MECLSENLYKEYKFKIVSKVNYVYYYHCFIKKKIVRGI